MAIDFTGKVFGSPGRGGPGRHGRVSQTMGIMTPWPNAFNPKNNPANAKAKAAANDLYLMNNSLFQARVKHLVSRVYIWNECIAGVLQIMLKGWIYPAIQVLNISTFAP